MSVQKRNELIEIIVNYNKQQDEYKRKLTMPSSYKVEILKEQVDKNVEAERLKTVDKMINSTPVYPIRLALSIKRK